MSRRVWPMPGSVKAPCGEDCPDRREGCRSACARWAAHEQEKRERYRRKELSRAAWRPDDLVMEKARDDRRRGR